MNSNINCLSQRAFAISCVARQRQEILIIIRTNNITNNSFIPNNPLNITDIPKDEHVIIRP